MLLLTLVTPAVAQSQEDDLGVAAVQDFSGGAALNGTYFDIRNQAGSGVGYQNGFTQIGALTPIVNDGIYLLAPQGRIIITDSQEVGVNLGLIGRVYNPEWDRIFGANVYYDSDETVLGNRYNQFGFGLETLSSHFDVRSNVYIPGSDTNRIGPVALSNNPFFLGNQLLFQGTSLNEEALKGVDFEVGSPLSRSTPWLRGFVGGYYYGGGSGDRNPVGIRTRVDAQVADDLMVGFMATHDSTFGTNLNAVVDFRFSGFRPTRWFPNFTTQERMLTPVQRHWRITTDTFRTTENVAAINPIDNQPYFIVFVDNSNTNAGPGSGTFEDPFDNVPGSAPNADIVYVRRGNSTAANPYDASIALVDNQRFLGEGRQAFVNAYANFGGFTQSGTFLLPGTANTGNYPFLTSSAGDVVTLANNNEVTGFNIAGAVGSAITNTPAGSNNFLLSYLNLTGNNTGNSPSGGGIFLSNTRGTGVVSNVNTSANIGYGAFVGAGGDLALAVNNVTANGNFNDNLNVTGGAGADITVAMTGANAFNGSLAGSGIVFDVTGGTGVLTTQNSLVATGNAVDGLRISARDGAQIGTGAGGPVQLNNANLASSGRDGLHVDVLGAGSAVNLQSNGLQGNNVGRDGYRYEVGAGATFTDSMTNAYLAGAGAVGYHAVVRGGTVNATGTGIQTQFSGREGVYVNAQNGSNATINLTNVQAQDSGRAAPGTVAGTRVLADASNVTLNINNLVSNNSTGTTLGYGLLVDATNNSNVTTNILRGNFNDVASTGVAANVLSGSGATVNLTDVTADRAGDNGFTGNVDGGQLVSNLIRSTFDNAGQNGAGDGLYVTVSNSPANRASQINATGSSFDLAAGNGANFVTGPNGRVGFNLNTSTMNDNGASGLRVDAGPNSLVSGIVTGGSLQNNDAKGAYVTATGPNTVAAVSFNGSTLDGNGEEGALLIATNAAILAEFVNSSVSNNGTFGVGFNGNGPGPQPSRVAFNNTQVNGNGDSGFVFGTSNGHQLIVDIENGSTFNDNGGVGIGGTISGPGTVVDYAFTDLTATGNAREGLAFDVINGGRLLLDVYNGNFSQNGQGGTYDGVRITASGAGSEADVIFASTDANDNGSNGFNFIVNQGAFMTAQVTDGSTASNNVRSGVNFVARDAGTVANLLMSGTSPTLFNSPNTFNSNGIAANAPGVNFDAQGVAQAVARVYGNASGNGRVDPPVNDPAAGININLVDVGNGAVEVRGSGGADAINNNGGLGVNINVVNSTLRDTTVNTAKAPNVRVESLAVRDTTILENRFGGLRITANGSTVFDLDAVNGAAVANAADISGNNISQNGGDGIRLSLSGSDAYGLTIDDNLINSNTGGNGINVIALNSSINNFGITNNESISGNGIDGINFDLNNSNLQNFLIDSNGLGTTPPTPVSEFDIEVVFGTGLTPSQQAIFSEAAARWAQVITGDIPDVVVNGVTVDDVVIDASGVLIDGPGGILGQAGPDTLRPTTFLPSTGTMQFDSADLAQMELDGTLRDVILHEMGHVLGIGTIWDLQGLLTGAGTADPRFIGPDATAEYNARFGVNEAGVPVENQYGPGTRDSHWRESVYGDELMTGIITGTVRPLSATTVASLGDQGYTVNINQADPFLQGLPAGTPVNHGTIRDTDPVVAGRILPAAASPLPRIVNNGVNGIDFNVTNSNVTGTISNNAIESHAGGDGIRMLNPTSANVISVNYDGNSISNNTGGRGVNLSLAQGVMNNGFTNNTIEGNGQEGVNLVLTGSAQSNTFFVGNSVSANGTSTTLSPNGAAGVNLEVHNAAVLTTGFQDNRINNNSSFGVNVVADGTANPAATVAFIGGPNGATNTIDGNVNAGISVRASNTAGIGLTVNGTTVSNTTAGSVAGYSGQGLVVLATGQSVVNPLNIGAAGTLTNFSGNTGSGIDISLNDTATAPVINVDTVSSAANGVHGLSLTTNSFAIAGNTTVTNSSFTGNGADGLHFDRLGNSFIQNVLIDTNTISGNNGDGIDINARARDLNPDVYTVQNNTIQGNQENGILANVEGDADLTITIADNLQISDNVFDGIRFTQNAITTDTPFIDASITGNQINRNGAARAVDGVVVGGSGISINATHGAVIDGNTINGNVAGSRANSGNGIYISGSSVNPNTGTILQDEITNNLISGNSVNGVFINSIGTNAALVQSNDIVGNTNDGIQLASSGIALFADIDDNLIQGNGGDGVEFVATNSGRGGLGANTVSLTANDILDSGRRGINVLNRGSALSTVNVGDGTLAGQNEVRRSQLEGVYVINTASTTQDANVNANDALAADGSADPTAVPSVLNFNMNANVVTANGQNSNSTQVFDTTGLVIRVGTNDSGSSYTDPDGNPGANNSFASQGRGGVVANVTENLFGGNFGADVTFQSFVSTINPATTAGAWTDQNENPRNNANDVFSPSTAQYQSDPLARLDLVFRNNTGEGIIATRPGAAYTNDEPVFKSRTQGQDNATDGGADDNGPFGSGTRPRNAQRLAGRFGLPPTLTIVGTGGNSDNFLYPGLGESTFRVNADANAANFGFSGVLFEFDADPYTGPGSANGRPLTAPNGGPFGIDNMPYGWGTLP